MYCYFELKLLYLKNQILFSIRVKELFELLVLWSKGHGYLLFWKSIFLRNLSLGKTRWFCAKNQSNNWKRLLLCLLLSLQVSFRIQELIKRSHQLITLQGPLTDTFLPYDDGHTRAVDEAYEAIQRIGRISIPSSSELSQSISVSTPSASEIPQMMAQPSNQVKSKDTRPETGVDGVVNPMAPAEHGSLFQYVFWWAI